MSEIQAGTEDFFTPLSPEEPYLFETGATVFGTAEEPVEFSFGGTSDLPSGDINPEDFAKFPKELFDKGFVEAGGAYRVINPKTKKMSIVIARHGDTQPMTGLGLAPHTYLELGQADKYIIDFRPVPPEKYPRAMYPAPTKQAAAQVVPALGETAEAGDDAGGLGEVSVEGGAPSGGEQEAKSEWIVDEETGEEYKVNPDGSETFKDGRTFYEDGAWTRPLGKKIVAWAPGMKTPAVIDPKDNKEPKIHKTKDDRFMKFDPEKGHMVEVTAPSGVTSTKGEEYAADRAERAIQSVDELSKKVSGKTVGWGSLLQGVPTTEARNFAAELKTLRGQIAFRELTEMRNASKTGGALGQVSNIELALLESSLGALDQGQSPENFKQQLEKIKTTILSSVERWNKAKELHPGESRQLNLVHPSLLPSTSPAPGKSPSPTPLQNLKPGGLIKDKSGRTWRLKEGGNPSNPKDYEPVA